MEQGGTTILVVEDEETFVEVLSVELSRAGYAVAVARDGSAALQTFENVHPDLVLLDLMIPKIPGLEVCRQLREHSAVPIVIVSARGEEEDILAGFDAGADDYISKPFRARTLVQRIASVIESVHGDEQSAETHRVAHWFPTSGTP